MKNTLALLFTLISLWASGNNYYIDPVNGDDATPVTTVTSGNGAWKSITRVNELLGGTSKVINGVTILFGAGDHLLIKAGTTLFGTINVNVSGTAAAPITIERYGAGANPVVTTLETPTGWTSLGGNIWRSASLTNNPSYLHTVTANNKIVAIGRWPDKDSLNSGFREITVGDGTSPYNKIIDNGLNINTRPSDLVAAKLCIRTNHTNFDTVNVLSITQKGSGTTTARGDSIVFSNATLNVGTGFGYFFFNALSTLTRQNEWFYNTTSHQLYYYSTVNPSTLGVRYSVTPNCLFVNGEKFVTVTGIDMNGSQNDIVRFSGTCSDVTIQDCFLNNGGRNGVELNSASFSNINILNCEIRNCCNSGISTLFANAKNIVSRGNKLVFIGMYPGMGISNNGNYCGIVARGDFNITSNNFLDSIGSSGLNLTGNGFRADSNEVVHFNATLGDVAAIYTVPTGTTQKYFWTARRSISFNIVHDGLGDKGGTPQWDDTEPARTMGIYCDNGTNRVDIFNNTVWNVPHTSFFAQSAWDLDLRNNKFLGSNYATRFADYHALYDIDSIKMKNNLFMSTESFVSTTEWNYPFYYASTKYNPAHNLARVPSDIDNNKYYELDNPQSTTIFRLEQKTPTGTNSTASYNLSGWRTRMNQDLNSTIGSIEVKQPSLGVNYNIYYNATSTVQALQMNDKAWVSTSAISSEDAQTFNTNYINLQPYSSMIVFPTGGGVIVIDQSGNAIRFKTKIKLKQF